MLTYNFYNTAISKDRPIQVDALGVQRTPQRYLLHRSCSALLQKHHPCLNWPGDACHTCTSSLLSAARGWVPLRYSALIVSLGSPNPQLLLGFVTICCFGFLETVNEGTFSAFKNPLFFSCIGSTFLRL